MGTKSEPSTPTPIEAYKAIIDQLVEETNVGVSERVVQEYGKYTNAPNYETENNFVMSLSQEQRVILARMLREERAGATHDVLALLTWWLDCRDVGLTFRGQPMPYELSGMGMHGDYVGRCDDWEWPEDESTIA